MHLKIPTVLSCWNNVPKKNDQLDYSLLMKNIGIPHPKEHAVSDIDTYNFLCREKWIYNYTRSYYIY